MTTEEESKKYPEKDRNRLLVFGCGSCGNTIEECNGSWKNVPKTCPKCSQGVMEEMTVAPINFFDRTRERDWDKGMDVVKQSRVLSGEIDPY